MLEIREEIPALKNKIVRKKKGSNKAQKKHKKDPEKSKNR